MIIYILFKKNPGILERHKIWMDETSKNLLAIYFSKQNIVFIHSQIPGLRFIFQICNDILCFLRYPCTKKACFSGPGKIRFRASQFVPLLYSNMWSLYETMLNFSGHLHLFIFYLHISLWHCLDLPFYLRLPYIFVFLSLVTSSGLHSDLTIIMKK